jgi:cytochrome c oxidase accessory protein FixG
MCVQVCPTGIDIRKGLQYECIGCAACIDGCNQVMDRMGYPRGLIRYSTTHALEQGLERRQMFARVLRPRVLIYSGILLMVIAAILTALALRTPFKADIIRDRMLGREVEDGLIENSYSLQLMNSTETAQRFSVSVSGIESAYIHGTAQFEVAPAGVRLVPLSVRIKSGAGQPGSNALRFQVQAQDLPGQSVDVKSTFFVPRR